MNVTPQNSTAPVSRADAAAHRAASFVHPSASAPTDSDPDADELLRRVRSSRSNLTVCPECHAAFSGSAHVCQPKAAPAVDAARLRVETETAYLLRDRQGYDEYRQWAQGAAA